MAKSSMVNRTFKTEESANVKMKYQCHAEKQVDFAS
jgi:hypothetical protein